MTIRIVKRQGNEISVSPVPGFEECDFCSGPDPVKDYQAADFVIHYEQPTVLTPNVSCGEWTACRECAELVDSGRWDELITRVMAVVGADGEGCRTYLEQTYSRLREAMKAAEGT